MKNSNRAEIVWVTDRFDRTACSEEALCECGGLPETFSIMDS